MHSEIFNMIILYRKILPAYISAWPTLKWSLHLKCIAKTRWSKSDKRYYL